MLGFVNLPHAPRADFRHDQILAQVFDLLRAGRFVCRRLFTKFLTQHGIVSGFFLSVQQMIANAFDLFEQLLGQAAPRTFQMQTNEVRSGLGGASDRLHVAFKGAQPQQAIVVRRPLFRRNVEPLAVGVECA